jgi:hypothetical protein
MGVPLPRRRSVQAVQSIMGLAPVKSDEPSSYPMINLELGTIMGLWLPESDESPP